QRLLAHVSPWVWPYVTKRRASSARRSGIISALRATIAYNRIESVGAGPNAARDQTATVANPLVLSGSMSTMPALLMMRCPMSFADQLDRLQQFLDADDLHDEALDYLAGHGFLTALCISPVEVP